MANFIYTKHANLRIEQRNLSKAQIEQTVKNPDKILPSFRGRSLVQKDFSGKKLEVVYKKQNDTVIIITAYRLTEG